MDSSKTDVDVAVVLADSTGAVVFWSEAATSLFGHDRADILGRSLDEIVPEQYRDAHWAAFRSLMAGGPGKLDGMSAHIPVRCADGQTRTFPGRFGFVRDPAGAVCASLASFVGPAGKAAPFSPLTDGSSDQP